MKGTAALLLFVVAATAISASTISNKVVENERHDNFILNDASVEIKEKAPPTDSPNWNSESDNIKVQDYVKPLTDPKGALMQEIRSLDEETLLRRSKAQEGTKVDTSTAKSSPVVALVDTAKIDAKVNSTIAKSALKKLVEAEDMGYDEDDNLDDGFDDEDEEDEDTDEEYDDSEEELDDEQIMIQCPDYCRCTGQYASATTAICTKLIDKQQFGPGIAHLRIEDAGEIRLGPHALRARGLQRLETITIVDTQIVELDRRAFDGIPYLYAVNLTRNGLQDIHPQTFQNNSQLNLLSIIGNPLKHNQYLKGTKHYLLEAPSVAEFYFSNNGITKLPRTAFQKMPSLAYVSLKGNKLKEIEKPIFDSLESLVDLDLSNNLLNEIPVELLENTNLQTLRVSGNNLSTLETIRAPKLTTLEAANNKIKVIAKDDLSGVPLLDQLVVKSNELKRIHQHAFANLDQLAYLDISDNKLTSLTEHHLRNNPRLQILLMNDNPALESLPVFKTAGLEHETYSVYRLECSNCGLDELDPQTFDAMPAVTRLKLSKNRLTGLPNGLLKSLSSLRELDLSDNLIDSLDPNMFHGARTLNKLSLAGNPLVTLQTTPFLETPGLTKLDVSRCELERVWSEARAPLKSLRFLSVRGNLLRRITVEELRATPKLSSLDLAHNPLDCDDDFNLAVQWLTDHGVIPTEAQRSISNYGDTEEYSDVKGITQWRDLAKIVCDGVDAGPPPRKKPVPHKPNEIFNTFDDSEEANLLLKNSLDNDEALLKLQLDHTGSHNEEIWEEQDPEYNDYMVQNASYRPWYGGALWPVLTVIVVTLAVLLLAAHIAMSLAKRRGRGPVIRPPMILRQGLVDNKNCGLVYKPLQEEIATPHMPKRGSFYSSSTFHYDKIVPESV